jgi:hypothetical protein
MSPNLFETELSAVVGVHKELHRYAELLTVALRPLVGQQVLKADGNFLKKVSDILPRLPFYNTGEGNVYVYFNITRYNIWLYAEMRADDGKNNVTAKADGYLAKVDGGILREVTADLSHMPVYDVETIRARAMEITWHEARIREIQNKGFPEFGHRIGYYNLAEKKPESK